MLAAVYKKLSAMDYVREEPVAFSQGFGGDGEAIAAILRPHQMPSTNVIGNQDMIWNL